MTVSDQRNNRQLNDVIASQHLLFHRIHQGVENGNGFSQGRSSLLIVDACYGVGVGCHVH